MAAERVPMRKLREVIRLRLACGLSGRAIAQSCRLSVSTVSGYLGRVAVAKLGWPLPAALDDDTVLERLLFPDEHHPVRTRPEPDWAALHRELRRPHVTKQLLWQEYREAQPDGYQYSQFCARYAAWATHLPVTMRQVHRAGEKGFVDFSGGSLPIVDLQTGETTPATLFLAVLGASNLTYAEPVLHQDLPTWIGVHVNALAYWGGVPAALVPDNPKVGVTRPDYYDPGLNPRPSRHLGQSRRDLFEAIERAALRPLPARPYELALWARPKVSIDYHVEFEDHYYSVPWQLRGERLDLRATATTVELFQHGRRVASHVRSHVKHQPSTDPAHMPAAHRAHLEWSPSRLIAWGATVGPATAGLMEAIMQQRPHPEQGYRACLGLMRLQKRYPAARLERACARAPPFRACSYKSVGAS